MAKAFKYYYDLMSQPSRALWIAFRLAKIPFEDCPVALRKREQLSDEFKKINRFQKVPCIVDNDFHLSESVAIVRYLAAKGLFSDALYPAQLQERARVDEFLEWQHLNVRINCGMYFLRLWLYPQNGLALFPSDEKIARLRKEMEVSLKIVEKTWLKDTKYVAGNKLTIADLFGVCELEQTRLTQYEVGKKFPKTADWIAQVREETNPFYDEAHEFIYKKSKADVKHAKNF